MAQLADLFVTFSAKGVQEVEAGAERVKTKLEDVHQTTTKIGLAAAAVAGAVGGLTAKAVGWLESFVRAGLAGSNVGAVLSFELGRLARAVAGLVAPELMKLIEIVRRLTEWFAKLSEGKGLFGGIFSYLAKFVDALVKFAEVTFKAAAAFAKFVLMFGGGSLAFVFVPLVLLYELFQRLGSVLERIMDAVGEVFDALSDLLDAVADAFFDLLAAAADFLAALAGFDDFKDFLESVLVVIKKVAAQIREVAAAVRFVMQALGLARDRGVPGRQPLAPTVGGPEAVEGVFARLQAAALKGIVGKTPDERTADAVEAWLPKLALLQSIIAAVENAWHLAGG